MIKEIFNLKKNWKFWLLIGFGLIFLIVLIFSIVKSPIFKGFQEDTAKNLGSFLVEGSLNTIKREFYESNSEYPIIIGDSFVSWQELDQVIEFEKLLWQNGSLNWQLKGLVSNKDYEKKIIIDLLVERKIVEQIAKNYSLSELSDGEIEIAKKASFGVYRDASISIHPEIEARSITRALKAKIDNELVRRYSGVFIHIKFKGQGASSLKDQGIDPKIKAKEKIDELYEKAKNGLETNSLIELANKDQEIFLLNDNLLQETFDGFSSGDFSIPSQEIGETIKDLVSGQISKVFEMTALTDTNPQKYPFAYGFLKIDKVTGSVQNLINLIQDIKNSLKIEVNIN